MESHSIWGRQGGRRLRRSATPGVASGQPYIVDSSNEESASVISSPLQSPPTSYIGLDLEDPEDKTIITTTDGDVVDLTHPSSVKVDERATCRLICCKGDYRTPTLVCLPALKGGMEWRIPQMDLTNP
jgi:hypothetical protein